LNQGDYEPFSRPANPGRPLLAGKTSLSEAPKLGAEAFYIVSDKAIAVHFGKGRWVAQLEATANAGFDPDRLRRLAKKILAHS
jgi:hypothetical protein